MDLPIPKNEKTQVALPHLPVLPSMIAQLLPAPVPRLEYKPGLFPLVESFLHNWKLLQLKRAAEREADISLAKMRQTQAQFAQIEALLLFGARYELALQKVRNEQEMLDINRQTAEANLTTIQLRNILAQIEAQKAQLELQHMMKELGSASAIALGGSEGDGTETDEPHAE
jgi:hypothetical protein